jgi:hypothetical protein
VATGSLTVSGSVTGLPTGSKSLGPLTVTPSAPIGDTRDVPLTTGDNTVTVPAGTTLVVITLPAGNTQAVKLKQVGGDSGTPLALAGLGAVLVFPASPPASFVLNAAGAVTAEVFFE